MEMERAAEAAREGDIAYFQSLPAEKVTTLCYKKDEDGRSLLHTACTSGSVELVGILLERSKASSINDQDDDGWTPLMSSVSCGHEAIVKLLLGAHAQVDQVNSSGRTALFYAASKGKPDIIQLLLQAGSSPTIKDCTGGIPLHRAAGAGHLKAIEVLLQVTPRHMINARDKSELTPALVAMQAGHSAAVAMLDRFTCEANVFSE